MFYADKNSINSYSAVFVDVNDGVFVGRSYHIVVYFNMPKYFELNIFEIVLLVRKLIRVSR
jgi:hypothetical protein